MRSLLEVLNLSADYLKDKGIQNSRREAQDLIGDALGIGRMQLYMEYDRPLTEPELEMLRGRLARRAKGEPNAYIHGQVKFLDCVLKVSPDVLIPRQETEILTDIVIKSLEKEDLEGKILWDVCCGSGCMGIAIKKKFPKLLVVLSDISSKALSIARENATHNGVEVSFLEGDLLAPFAGKKTHYLVSNPPYVARRELAKLDVEVRDYEPIQALVSGETGLEIYERFAKELPAYLNPGGKAWFELGAGQGEAAKRLFQGSPWKSSKSETDWAGKDRFFFLEF